MTAESILQNLTFVAVALWVSAIYETLKRIVGPIRPGWREEFYQRRRGVPVVLGTLVGLLSNIPAAPPFESTVGRLIYFGLAGYMSGTVFGFVRKEMQRQGAAPPGSSFPPGPR